MHLIATALTTIALTAGLAACGDDDTTPAGSTPTTAETTAADPTATEAITTGDEPTEAEKDLLAGRKPFTTQARIAEIREVSGTKNPQTDQDAGFVVLTAEETDGPTYHVLVPADVELDETAQRVLRDPDCAGKVLADLTLVQALPNEKEGDTVLVSAKIDTENC